MAKRYHDSAMISESPSSMSYMPENVVIKKYPPCSYNMKEEYDDTLGGIDAQKNADGSAIKRSMKPRKA